MAISRRTFLVRTAQCAVLFGLAPGISSCGGVTREDTPGDEGYEELSFLIGPERAEILRLASLAPSSHNTQPWTVTITDDNAWILGSAPERRLPEVDPENRETLLSIGAFIENLVTAAAAHGFDVSITPAARSAGENELVRLELRNTVRRDYPLRRLSERRTLRSGFKNEAIDAEDFSFIVGGEEGFYYYPSFSKEAVWLDDATVAATEQQVQRENVQEELARWIRWSDDEAKKHRNGMTPESMDITGIAGWYVRNFYGTSDVLSKDFRKASVDRARKQVAEGGGWIVTTSADASPASLIETGRRFERIFLRARERKIAMHPMSQALQEKPWAAQCRDALKLSGFPRFLIRVGYARDYPPPVSLRMPLTAITAVERR